MQKESVNSCLTAPYEYYLADLFREIETQCAPFSHTRKAGAIIPNLPPIPQIFEQLPIDALTNIRWAVQIYFDYLKPLGSEGLNERANALYAMARESAKNRGEDEKSRRAVEKHLTMTMLANRRESLQENSHLYFLLLALMQIGMLQRILKSGMEPDAYTYEIERSIDRGFSSLRKQEAAKQAYERRQREEKEENRKHGGEGGKETSQRYYKKSKDYALRRYAQICEEKNQQGKKISKREIAHTIHKELQKKCGIEIAAECPDWRVLYEKWILKFPAHQ